MKLISEHRPLLRAVSHAQGVVERRNTLPALSNVLIDAREEHLRIAATDMDLEVIEIVPSAEILSPGAAMVDARMLHEIVRKSPSGCQIEFEADEKSDNITLSLGRSRFQLHSMGGQDYPSFAEDDLPHRFVLQASEWRRLINKTRFIIPNEETRHNINGLHLHTKEEEGGNQLLRAVATDGHRLACISMPLPSGAEEMPAFTIPRKAVLELQKLLEGVEEDITFEVSSDKSGICRVKMEGVVLTSKLVEGDFPEYERVIPQNNEICLTVDARAFSEGVDRVSTIASEKSRAVKLILEENLLRINATNHDGEDAQEDISATYEGEGMEIGFNGGYLLDIAGAFEGDDARFFFLDKKSPAIIQDPRDEDVLYVIMPMTI